MYSMQISFDDALKTKEFQTVKNQPIHLPFEFPQEIGKTWEDIQSEDDGEMRQQSDSGR